MHLLASFTSRKAFNRSTPFLVRPFLCGIISGILFNMIFNFGKQQPIAMQHEEIFVTSSPSDLLGTTSDMRVTNMTDQEKADRVKKMRKIELRKEVHFKLPMMVCIVIDAPTDFEVLNLHKKTLGADFQNLLYFSSNETLTKDIENSVILPDVSLFTISRYLASNYKDESNFYWIVDSRSVLNGFQLKRLLDKIQMKGKVFLGNYKYLRACGIEDGVLISNDILKDFLRKGSLCNRNQGFLQSLLSLDSLFNSCINQISKVGCSSYAYDVNYKTTQLQDLDISQEDDLSAPLIISHVSAVAALRKAIAYLYRMEINALERDRRQLATRFMSLVVDRLPLLAEWPMETDANDTVQAFENRNLETMANSSTNLVEVDRWFNLTHSVSSSELFNLGHQDWKDDDKSFGKIIKECTNSLPIEAAHWTVGQGWLKEYTNNGFAYYLTLEHDGGPEVVRRHCQVYQLLGQPRIIAMGRLGEAEDLDKLVEENKVEEIEEKEKMENITLVIPVSIDRLDKAIEMFHQFVDLKRRGEERLNLVMMGIKDSSLPDSKENPFFKIMKAETKTKLESQVIWKTIASDDVAAVSNSVRIVDATLAFINTSLILIGSVDMKLDDEYLRQVRRRTIKNSQVFAPVPLTDYHPKFSSQLNVSAEIKNKTKQEFSHFDKNNYQHLSFFKEDYVNAKRILEKEKHGQSREDTEKGPQDLISVYDLFLDYSMSQRADHKESKGRSTQINDEVRLKTIHLLRAPEPSLRLKYHKIFCNRQTPHEAQARCQMEGLLSMAPPEIIGNIIENS